MFYSLHILILFYCSLLYITIKIKIVVNNFLHVFLCVLLGLKYIKNQQWLLAFLTYEKLIGDDLNAGDSIFKQVTGFTNYYNYLVSNDTSSKMSYMGDWIQSEEIRKAIHVGNITFNGISKEVAEHLLNDFFQSITDWISELLNHYRILFYSGQLDIVVAYPLTLNFLQNLKFDASEEYKTAKRYQWYVGSELAGYVKHAGNLTEALVRNAGHMVPAEQPRIHNLLFNLNVHIYTAITC